MEATSDESRRDPRAGSAWRSPWLYASIGLILTVLAVNITMVVFAITTNPGLVRADYYESGREMERTIATRAESGPGWTMKLDVPGDATAGDQVSVYFILVDRVGQPATPDSVTFFAYRPSDASLDFELPMEAEAPGRYVARVSFPLKGAWDTLAEATSEGQGYRVNQRISVID